MPPSFDHPLIEFLLSDLAVPVDSIAMGLRQATAPHLLPMVLWQYGLVTTAELNQIFEWVETTAPLTDGIPASVGYPIWEEPSLRGIYKS